MRKLITHPAFGALVFVLFCLGLIIGGFATLAEGGLHYDNYFGGRVFAPFAIALGVMLLVLTPLFSGRDKQRSPKLRGKAARLERQAKETRFPVEDFDKPWNP